MVAVAANVIDSTAELLLGEWVCTSHTLETRYEYLPMWYPARMRVLRTRIIAARKKWPFSFGPLPLRTSRNVVFVGREDTLPLYECGPHQIKLGVFTYLQDDVPEALAAAAAEILQLQIQCGHTQVYMKA